MISFLIYLIFISNGLIPPSKMYLSYNNANVGSEKRIGKPGKVYYFHFELSDKTTKKIGTINQLCLPDELIDIIKDYLYYSVEQQLHYTFMSRINEDINGLHFNLRNISYENEIFEWEICSFYYEELCILPVQPNTIGGIDFEESKISEIYICNKCGNYSDDKYYMSNPDSFSKHMKCYCASNPINFPELIFQINHICNKISEVGNGVTSFSAVGVA